MRALAWLFGALLAVPAAAAELGQDDFAYGLRLEPERSAALYRLELPEAVYLGATRADLGDVRVFNAQGEAVPFTLRIPPQTSINQSEPVPVFPIPGEVREGEMAVRVRTDDRGAVIDVTPSRAVHSAQPIGGYLFDLSQLQAPVHRLTLDWAEPEGGFVAQVELAVSEDLQDWRPLGGATLAELRMAGHQLRRNSIELPGVRGRYLRIDWPRPLAGVSLQTAQAELRDAPAPRLRWREIDGRPDDQSGVVFDSGGHMPVTQVQLAFADDNRLLEARLASGNAMQGPWQPRSGALFYRLRADQAELISPPLTLATVTDRYWRLSAAGQTIPSGVRLRLGWQPRELVFLAQGGSPYVLAFGSGVATAPTSAVPQLLRNVEANPHLVAEAKVAGQVTLAGPRAAEPPPAPLPWRRWALWAVLIAAAAGLGLMAWRLARDMRAPKD